MVREHHSKTCKNSGGEKTSAGLGHLRISKYCKTDAIFGISASKCTISDQGSENLRYKVQNGSPYVYPRVRSMIFITFRIISET